MSSNFCRARQDRCEGLFFKYYRADKNGRYRSVPVNHRFRAAEDYVLKRMQVMFRQRPDLMMELACFPGGVEVRLYAGGNGELAFLCENGNIVACATYDGDEMILEFAIEEIEYDRNNEDGIDVVVHELTHLLDYLTDEEGMLPKLSPLQQKRFRRARAAEKARLGKGNSVLNPYAGYDDNEFLAVLVETFFKSPRKLREGSPELYGIMSDYFRLEP